MKELAQTRIRYGYQRLHVLLKREGWQLGRKQCYRIYREEELQLRAKLPKRRESVGTGAFGSASTGFGKTGASIPSSRVVRVLEQLVEMFGRPEAIRLDNGPELTAADDWLTDYNEYRPHDSLGNVPPAVFKPRVFNQDVAASGLSA